jgi:hypothetical protein
MAAQILVAEKATFTIPNGDIVTGTSDKGDFLRNPYHMNCLTPGAIS